MKRVSNLLAWGALAIVAALCFLNWQTLAAVAPLDLVVWQGDAPLGIVLLAMAGVLLVFFLFAYLNNQISSLLENRKLLKEIQRVQALADKAEASRMENLHQLISTEFRLLNERIATTNVMAVPSDANQEQAQPLSLTELVARR
ncbi:MAG: LapA family protein [Burkholderiaceae bacterium]|nr:LapA family protein [Rhodoferax sp.]MCB2004067.1 LapA family protein [Rhodoferax sp.]MCP5260458.1 LapA family protein [Rhodoferax sp.]MCW5645481.1 LapA family protein [Rhodoferax sp.]MCZ4315053.1 LapA family protein [Comamonadaceae bacterium G21597-S1]